MLCYGPCRDIADVENLRALLTATSFPLQVHNEVFLPLLQGICRLAPEGARAVVNIFPPLPISRKRKG